MPGMPREKGAPSESEIRKIVREELRRHYDRGPTRRWLLGTVGMAGIAGLAGCTSSGNPNGSQDGGFQREEDREAQPQADDVSTTGYLAERGDVQSTLHDAVEDGVGQVDLVSGLTYDFTDSIEIPPGVALNCTGSHINLSADINGFELHTQSQVFNPTVRTTDIDGYSSSIFHVFPKQFGDSFGTNRPVPLWTINGGWSEMTPGEGTCIELHGVRENASEEYKARRDNRNVYFCFVSHNCIGGHRYAYLHREGGETTRGGHVNSNIIQGFAENATKFIETDDTSPSSNMVNGNKFYLTTQPGDASEWLWYANKGENNELFEWGKNWDYASYSDNDDDGFAESWYIGEDCGPNYVWRKQSSASGGLGSTVLDESNGASGSSYILLERLGIPVDELEVRDSAK